MLTISLNVDIALSFQDAVSCEEVWNKIQEFTQSTAMTDDEDDAEHHTMDVSFF